MIFYFLYRLCLKDKINIIKYRWIFNKIIIPLLLMKKLLNNKWVKLLFSLSIMLSAVPSIYQDFTYGHSGEWTHYGMMVVGVLYFIESTLWTLDIWKT
tara:strand:+ start:767 stop:1060 length:294 start_codon:yes stop_codon:yes gene_type:complete